MKKLSTLFTTLSATTYSFLAHLVQPVSAQITNPPIGDLGDDFEGAQNGSLFTTYFVNIWQAVIVIGGLAVIVFFVWGAIEWILAGGDSGKIQKARDRMTQSAIGMIVLVGSFLILGLISELFFGDQFDLLNPKF